MKSSGEQPVIWTVVFRRGGLLAGCDNTTIIAVGGVEKVNHAKPRTGEVAASRPKLLDVETPTTLLIGLCGAKNVRRFLVARSGCRRTLRN